MELSAEDLIAFSLSEEDRSALAEAKEFLQAELAGGPQSVDNLNKTARQAGISEATLRRARMSLGIKPTKAGFGGPWQISLPTKPLIARPKAFSSSVEPLPGGMIPFDGRLGRSEYLGEAFKVSGQSPGSVTPCTYHSGPQTALCLKCGASYKDHLAIFGGVR